MGRVFWLIEDTRSNVREPFIVYMRNATFTHTYYGNAMQLIDQNARSGDVFRQVTLLNDDYVISEDEGY